MKPRGSCKAGTESVLDELPGLPSKDQVEALKAYLFDTTLGPIPLAKQMSDEAGALIKKLGTFEQKMNEYNAKMQAFTAGSSAMMTEVNTPSARRSRRSRIWRNRVTTPTRRGGISLSRPLLPRSAAR